MLDVEKVLKERKKWLLDHVWCCEYEDLDILERLNVENDLKEMKEAVEWINTLKF